MLEHRIVSTLRFFDLQDTPLTLFELHKFLLNDLENIRNFINKDYEITENYDHKNQKVVSIDEILSALDSELKNQIETKNGYYCLAGRISIIDNRLNNYFYGFKREKRIKKFAKYFKYIPFLRGVAVLGSQALGQQKPNSDIDLLVITDPKFLGLGRGFLTVFLQIFGVRRHGSKVAGRFCLNHYLAGPITLPSDKNLYTAMEYVKLRPLCGSNFFREFLKSNLWTYDFFPNTGLLRLLSENFSTRDFLEKLFNNNFGRYLENKLKNLQLKKIKQGEFIVADSQEMSFHPNNRKKILFKSFFEG